ncbi:MAG TPA: redoxin domain-containing protein [Candidatus Anammoximicrobium sp.]|nr:redoxin domain-containing protein [Candidatus Anammoximicrobium sp.]
MWQRTTWLTVLLIAGFWSVNAYGAASKSVTPLPLGASAPDFALPGVDGKTYRLSDFASAKVLVIIFTCNHCPTAQAYEDRIIQLHADFKARGVAVVAISPNDPLAVRLDELGYTDVGDSLDDMKVRAKDRGFAFPYLYDGDKQATSTAFGVLATPHVFIFDADRKLRYQGRIDDSDVGVVKSHDTRNAIEALLAGRPVPVATTRVFGCSTKWSDKRPSAVESLAKWDAEEVAVQTIDEAGVRKLAQNDTKNLRLINVWATWCIPCVEEMPKLVTINRMYRKRKFEMITISLDAPQERDVVLKRLQEKHVSSTNYIFATGDRDKLAEALDQQWPGPVPYTILVAPGGKILYRKHDTFEPLELKKAIVSHLGRTYASR